MPNQGVLSLPIKQQFAEMKDTELPFDINSDHSEPGDDIIIERLDPDEAEMFEDELDMIYDDDQKDSSRIKACEMIDSLPDYSMIRDNSATDSTCCIISIKVNNNSMLLAVGSCDEKCRLYLCIPSRNKLLLVQTLSEFGDSVIDLAFSYDQKYLAAASYDATVRVYSISLDGIDQQYRNPLGKCTEFLFVNGPAIATLIHTLEGPTNDIEWLRWHPKGYAIIAGSKDSTIWMWWALTGKVMNVFSGHGTSISCGIFAHGGKVIVTGKVSIIHFVYWS